MTKENNKAKAWEKRVLKSRKKIARTLKFREFMNVMYDIISTFHMFEASIILMWICIITLNLQRSRIDANNMNTLDIVSLRIGIVVLILSMLVSTFFAIVLLYRIIRHRHKKNTDTILTLDIGEGTTDFIYPRPNVTPAEHVVMSGSGSIKREIEH